MLRDNGRLNVPALDRGGAGKGRRSGILVDGLPKDDRLNSKRRSIRLSPTPLD